jgi:hypothetical protein
MAYYGFRLFEIELRALSGRKAIPFEDCGGEHYSVIAHRILQTAKGTTIVEEKTADPDDVADGADGDPFAGRRGIRVLKVERLGHTLWIDVLAGRFGDQEIAQGAPGQTEDSDLRGRAPSYTFRIGFYFPAKGTRGVVAIEDISRSCPIDLVRQLLLKGSRAEAEAKKPKKGEEEKPPIWWKLIITPMVDEEQVTRLINSGKSQRVELKKHGLGAGRGRDALEYELSAPGLTDSQRNEVAQLVASWGRDLMKRRRATPDERSKMGVPSDTDGARELATLLGQKIQALDFDDGFVVVEDGDGKTKKISPTRLNEVFTYPLSRNGRPSDVAFHERTRETARRLATSMRITGMEWPKKP